MRRLIALFDYAIGAIFSFAIFAFGLMAFAATGGTIKGYEIDAMGGAYTDFLAHVESEARTLRADYCERADSEVAQASNCGASNTLLGGLDGRTMQG